MNHTGPTGSPLVVFPKTYEKALVVHLETTTLPTLQNATVVLMGGKLFSAEVGRIGAQ